MILFTIIDRRPYLGWHAAAANCDMQVHDIRTRYNHFEDATKSESWSPNAYMLFITWLHHRTRVLDHSSKALES